MNLREQIIRDEGGVKTKLYYVNGIPHIGVGHNLAARDIPEAAAELIYAADLAETIGELAARLPWGRELGDVRWAALVNMAYTMGTEGLMGFGQMMLALRARDFSRAAAEVLDSAWATTPGQDHDRARRVAEQIRTGEWT